MKSVVTVPRRNRGAEGERHAERERRLDEIRDVVDGFMFDLGRLIAGQDADFEQGVDPALVARVRAAVGPFLMSGDAMRPDFGAFGELRVTGDLLDVDVPVRACLEFEDRCIRETADGQLIAGSRRRLRASLCISMEPCRVLECAVEVAG